jgi:hypothetical protein
MGFSDNGHYLVMYDPEAVPAALSSANICKHKDYGSVSLSQRVAIQQES